MKTKIILATTLVALLGILVIFAAAALAAAPSPAIAVQGVLKNSANNLPVADGTYSVKFRIYNEQSGTEASTCDLTSPPCLVEQLSSITTTGGTGTFSVVLNHPDIAKLPGDQQYYLGIKVGTDPEMGPQRSQLTFAAYSFAANRLLPTSWPVGIGTTNPGRDLSVKNTTVGDTFFNIVSADDAGWAGQLRFTNSAGTLRHLIVDEYDTNTLLIRTGMGASAARTVWVDGNVGIGTASPSNIQGWHRVLDVNGAAHSKILATTITGGLRTGLYSHSSWPVTGGAGVIGTESNHPLAFITNYDTKMLITTGGKVGIGTVVPEAKLHVAHSGSESGLPDIAAVYGDSQTVWGPSNTGVGIYGKGNRWAGFFEGNTYAQSLGVDTPNGVLGAPATKLHVGKAPYSGTIPYAYITTDTANQVAFMADSTPGITMTLPSGKNIGIASAGRIAYWAYGTATSGVTIGGKFTSVNGPGVYACAESGECADPASTTRIGVYGRGGDIGVEGYGWYGGSGIGVKGTGAAYDFYASGAGTDYGSASSIRWKTNITSIDKALEKVLNMRGVYFDWDAEHGGERDIGMIAEEVGKVVPEVVSYEQSSVYATGMDYGRLTALLIEAMKEQHKQIEALQAEVEMLKTNK